jgi:hypothetical protein
MSDEIVLNGKKYVLATKAKAQHRVSPVSIAKKKPVICRTYSAGVFFGYLKSRDGKEVVLNKARRIHYWDGAASLSELAMRGVSKPHNCRFPVEVDEVLLTECVELLPVTKEAVENINAVPVWSK